VNVRNVFKTLNNAWKFFPANTLAAWDLQAAGRNYAGRNHFLGINVPRIQGQADLAQILMAPGSPGTVPPASISVVGAAGQITVSATANPTPAGFVLDFMIFGVINNVDPDPAAQPFVQEAADAAAPYSNVFAGLTPGSYVGFAFGRYTAPDGSLRYGISLQGVAVAT
jgi:hypothetical protein